MLRTTAIPAPHPPRDPMIRLRELCTLVGRARATIYRDMQAGTFPRPVVLGPNARGWPLSEIERWQAERIDARDTGADVGLRALNRHIGRDQPPQQRARRAA